MKLLLLFLLTFLGCRKDVVEFTILNEELSVNDTVRLKIQNNTDTNYILCLRENRIGYVPLGGNGEGINAYIVGDKQEHIDLGFSYYCELLDGTEEDYTQRVQQRKACWDSNTLVNMIPARASTLLNFHFIDSGTCYYMNYPFFHKRGDYMLSLKIVLYFNEEYYPIGQMEAINRKVTELKKSARCVVLHGIFESNKVRLRY